ncbi:hypothetical protein DFQ08_102669 [Winogradskyella arenosi]|uniref:Uncharacterized protein n=1 Tax=Winogradskyella arenosi TaxID=533325 RepID=A0A368ZJ30_9FLAO|nr:hypothetical protein DFQ08_102669 [Winogradskyella arenosi]
MKKFMIKVNKIKSKKENLYELKKPLVFFSRIRDSEKRFI